MTGGRSLNRPPRPLDRIARHIVAGCLVNGPERGEDPRDSVFGLEDRWSSTSRAAGGSGR